jgi:hypothetical protein
MAWTRACRCRRMRSFSSESLASSSISLLRLKTTSASYPTDRTALINSPAAGMPLSELTLADSVRSCTRASLTPGTPRSALSTRATHPPQCIPVIRNEVVLMARQTSPSKLEFRVPILHSEFQTMNSSWQMDSSRFSTKSAAFTAVSRSTRCAASPLRAGFERPASGPEATISSRMRVFRNSDGQMMPPTVNASEMYVRPLLGRGHGARRRAESCPAHCLQMSPRLKDGPHGIRQCLRVVIHPAAPR